MHVVGFTIEIYYDARSYKRHTCLHFVGTTAVVYKAAVFDI